MIPPFCFSIELILHSTRDRAGYIFRIVTRFYHGFFGSCDLIDGYDPAQVSFCLESLLGVQSSIVNVSSGREMAGQAPLLARHFRNHGTPVMIGPYPNNHSIIINRETNNSQFWLQ